MIFMCQFYNTKLRFTHIHTDSTHIHLELAIFVFWGVFSFVFICFFKFKLKFRWLIVLLFLNLVTLNTTQALWWYKHLKQRNKTMLTKHRLNWFSQCIHVTSVVSDSVGPHRWQPTRLPVPGTLQARTLEWVAISFSNPC